MSTPVVVLRVDLFAGWEAAQTATLSAALLAVIGVTATILTTSARARREHKADLYAGALGGVADYLEGPYRIRRKDGTSGHRNAITAALSDVKSAIDHSQELLRLHAPTGVANAYDDYVLAARVEAGKQMSQAWLVPAIEKDSDVNLHEPFDRTLSEKYRAHVVKVMQADLALRWWNPWRAARYVWLVRQRPGSPPVPAPSTTVEDAPAAGPAVTANGGHDTSAHD